LPSTLRPFLGSFVLRGLSLAIGCLGLAWGIFVLPQSEFADNFRDIEDRLLHFETFRRTTLTRTMESEGQQDLSACDTHSQRAILLMEMSLAESALQSGAVKEFDQRTKSLETRSTRVLSCTPRQSFVWLLIFQLQVLRGNLDERSFDLLGMSYETSPNEAWISIRRILVAMPLVLVASELIRQKIIDEFQLLIRYGFLEVAARAYLSAPESARTLLETRIEQFDGSKRKAFSDALRKFRT
jgi:hypothetical protein